MDPLGPYIQHAVSFCDISCPLRSLFRGDWSDVGLVSGGRRGGHGAEVRSHPRDSEIEHC